MSKSVDFETAMERLEKIVRQLEDGSVPLADALKLFREGTCLVNRCTELLDRAELEIVKLTKAPDGELKEEKVAYEPTE